MESNASITRTTPGEQTCRPYLALCAVVLAIWVVAVFATTRTTLWDRDESRYGTSALEMAASGHFLYPTFNGELRAHQPVMVYWLMAAPVMMLGPTEYAVRFPSTVAFAAICLMTGLIACELGGRRCCWLAALLVGTSPMAFMAGTAATTDALLAAFILLSQWIFVRAWTRGPRVWHGPAMGLAIGCALLTKGPLGLILPVLTITGALILARGRSAAGPFWRMLLTSILMGAGIFLAWGIPANAATGGAYWQIAIVERLPRRVFTAMEGHGGGDPVSYFLHLPYYLLVLVVAILPWTMYLPAARRALQHVPRYGVWGRSPSGLVALLAGMVVPPLILMTLLVSKLPHYALPVVPWMAVLLALGLNAASLPDFPIAERDRFRRIAISFVFVYILIAAAVGLAPWVLPVLAPWKSAGVLLALLAFAVLGGVTYFLARNDFLAAVRIHALGMVAGVVACGLLVLPSLENLVKPGQILARELGRGTDGDGSVACLGWTEPGMHFYLGGRTITYLADDGAFENWALKKGPATLISTRGDADRIKESLESKGFRKIAQSAGLDHVRGGWVVLCAFRRD